MNEIIVKFCCLMFFSGFSWSMESAPQNFNYLSAQLRDYNSPELRRIRNDILNFNVSSAVARMKNGGDALKRDTLSSISQTESQAKQTLEAARGMSSSNDVIDQAKNDTLPISYFSQNNSAVSALLKSYIGLKWKVILSKELYKLAYNPSTGSSAPSQSNSYTSNRDSAGENSTFDQSVTVESLQRGFDAMNSEFDKAKLASAQSSKKLNKEKSNECDGFLNQKSPPSSAITPVLRLGSQIKYIYGTDTNPNMLNVIVSMSGNKNQQRITATIKNNSSCEISNAKISIVPVDASLSMKNAFIAYLEGNILAKQEATYFKEYTNLSMGVNLSVESFQIVQRLSD